MSVQRLGEDRAARWRSAPLTYPSDELAGGSVPHGYRRLECTVDRLTRAAQAIATRRYLTALDRL
ncbi:hypothetical protein GCM10027053_18930 [Intrasporangium mesophilum]